MKAVCFEDLLSWRKSKQLAMLLYGVFSGNKDFSFKDQLLRSSVSIMNNIAEGFERSGRNEFKYFLSIAKGSCGEVRSMLYLARELKYIFEDEFKIFCNLSIEISKLIRGFLNKLNIQP